MECEFKNEIIIQCTVCVVGNTHTMGDLVTQLQSLFFFCEKASWAEQNKNKNILFYFTSFDKQKSYSDVLHALLQKIMDRTQQTYLLVDGKLVQN